MCKLYAQDQASRRISVAAQPHFVSKTLLWLIEACCEACCKACGAAHTAELRLEVRASQHRSVRLETGRCWDKKEATRHRPLPVHPQLFFNFVIACLGANLLKQSFAFSLAALINASIACISSSKA